MNFTSTLVFIGYLSISTLPLASPLSALDNAIMALEAGQTEQARLLFEKQKEDPRAMVYLAKIYIDVDLDEAENWIEKAVNHKLSTAEAHYVRGRIMARQAAGSIFSALRYAEQAVDSFTKAVQLQPDSIQYRKGLMQFHTSAPSIAGGELDIAKEQIEKIRQLDPKAGVAAEINFELSQDNDALAEILLQQAKQTYKDIPDFFFQAGMFYQRRGNYQVAFEELTLAISKSTQTKSTEIKSTEIKSTETKASVVAKYHALYQLGRTSVLGKNNIEAGIKALSEYISEAPELDELVPKDWAEFRLANLMALSSQESAAKIIYLRLAKTDNKELAKEAKQAAKKI
jgi:tetratricopeptide (TPR) repeat protein